MDVIRRSPVFKVSRPLCFLYLVWILSFLAVAQESGWAGHGHGREFLPGPVIGLMLIALLVLLAAPHERLRRAVGAPTSEALRLCLGANLVLGLIGVGLGYGEARAADFLNGWHISNIRSPLMLANIIVMACGSYIRSGWVAARLMRRVVALHLLVAVGVLFSGLLNNPRPELGRSTPHWAAVLSWASGLLVSVLMGVYLHRHRPRKGHCPVCRYNLTGNVSGQCPECGTPIAAGTEAAEAPEVKNAG